MKKKIILILVIILLTSCKNGKLDNKSKIEVKAKTPNVEDVTPPYIDDNPITVGLYQNGYLVKSIDTPMYNQTDIISLDVYFTNEEYTGSQWTKYNFNKYYAGYENIEKYKIGFHMSFDAKGEKREANILGPGDMYAFDPYIYNYLYDDVHQVDGAFYSHVEENEVTDETIYSSIKLYAWDIDNLESPLTLTVFTYNGPEDFDESGNYRGNSKYTITINRK